MLSAPGFSEKSGRKPAVRFGPDPDPRVKILFLVVTNFVMADVRTDGIRLFIKIGLLGLLLFLLAAEGERKAAVSGLLCFAGGYWADMAGIPEAVHGLPGFLLLIFTAMLERLYPCALAGFYVLSTTEISKLIESLRRLRVPEQVNLALAVVFRFIPVVLEERRMVRETTRIRHIRLGRGLGPLRLLTYKYVPLMLRTLSIGDELTVSALTKGLAVDAPRSSIYVFSFRAGDALLAAVSALALVLFFLG